MGNAKEVEMLTAHGVKVSLAVFLECLTFFFKAARGEWVGSVSAGRWGKDCGETLRLELGLF